MLVVLVLLKGFQKHTNRSEPAKPLALKVFNQSLTNLFPFQPIYGNKISDLSNFLDRNFGKFTHLMAGVKNFVKENFDRGMGLKL